MSSRNKRLSDKQLAKASLIYQTLKETRRCFGDHSIAELIKLGYDRFKEEPDIELEYFSIARADNLQISNQKETGVKYRGFIAAYAGSVRLIDNMALN
jgi:pantoate--beta-alanine ligase